MITRRRPVKLVAAAAMVAATLGMGATACGDDEPAASGGGSSATGERITLTLQTFGGGTNFGYRAAIEKWNREHPGVRVEHVNLSADFEGKYWPRMLDWLQEGEGAGDVIGIDEGGMGVAKARPQYFVDLAEYGLTSRRAEFPAWKWQNGVSADGRLFALGTDVGGMAVAYRKDLFRKAGLPTHRDRVSMLWPTWQDFIEVGRRFQAKVPEARFVDGLNTWYSVFLSQEAAKHGFVTYYDKNNQLIVESNPAVRAAFDFATQVHQAGISARLRSFTDAWYAGMRRGAFATVAAPGWMLGVVQGTVTENGTRPDRGKGLWDIAAVPGGSGNWGGSWLAVPSQTEHPKEAAELVDYLTSPEVQLMAFMEGGNLPSTLPAQNSPQLRSTVNEWFSRAPIGRIYGPSTTSLPPIFLGERHTRTKSQVENVVLSMDEGSIPQSEAWQRLVADARKAADG